MNKKKSILSMSLLVILLVCSLSLTLLACTDNNEKNIAVATSFVSIEINPHIELVLDQNNIVMSVTSANQDAEVMLWDEEGIYGASLDVAIKNIATYSVKYKYIKGSDSSISISAVSNNNVKAEQIYASVDKILTSTIKELNDKISFTIHRAKNIVLETELAYIKERFPNDEEIQALTLEKYKLITSAIRCNNMLNLKEATAMTIQELGTIINDARASAKLRLGRSYSIAVQQARFVYTTLKQSTLDLAYFSPDLNIGILSPEFATITEYVLAKSIYLAITQQYEIIRDAYVNPVFSDEDVKDILDRLNIDTTEYDDFKDKISEDSSASGTITKESLTYFLNYIHRNLTGEELTAFESKYEDINDILIQASISIDNSIEDRLNLTGQLDIGELSITIEFTNIKTMPARMNELKEHVEKLEKEVFDFLDAEQENIIIQHQESLNNTISKAEDAFEIAVNDAKNKAEKKLADIKKYREDFLRGLPTSNN